MLKYWLLLLFNDTKFPIPLIKINLNNIIATMICHSDKL